VSSNLPPHGEPEILDSSGGRPAGASTSGSGRRTALIVGGIVGGVAVVGAGAWAASWYLSSGPQPAEALPATTIAYADINLDPSGDQKIEALKTLNKFPGFTDELDLDATDDLRKDIFEKMQEEGTCTDLDYAKDIEPWLGDRMAVAAVDSGGDEPTPVFVVQVTDAGKAVDGLDKLLDCGDAASSDDGGYAINGGWAVIAETEALADEVVDAAGDGTLAADDDFQHWTDEAGDDGIMTMYAAPEAGDELAKLLVGESGMASMSGMGGMQGMEEMESTLGDEDLKQFKDFRGAAMKVRFSDGAVEAEFAGGFVQSELVEAMAGDSGDAVVATLPDDTALAFGASLEPGWFEAALDYVASIIDDGRSADDLMAEAESESGLELPEDAETLTGDGFAIAVSSDVDIEAMINSGDPGSLGVGMKVKGDPDAVETVLDKIRPQTGDESLLQSKTSGDYISFGPDGDWLDALSEDGALGDSHSYQDVVPESGRSSSVFYLNVDTGDDWLVSALEDAGAPDDVIDNVRPFSALGMSSWVDGEATHSLIKLTTD